MPLPLCALTIGNFDGVHRGHQRIIGSVHRFAERIGGAAVVLTFEPHPLSVLRPDQAPARLTPLDEKLGLLAAAGADVTVVARADRALLALTAEEFVERVVRQLGPKHIIEGLTFGFGRGRTGNTDTLRRLGPRYGFEVCVVEPVEMQVEGGEQAPVSSSMIRGLIARGLVEQAAAALGRPYAVFGPVEHGRHRGATLGFPTVNLAVSDQLIPADGVYAGWVREADPLLTPVAEPRGWTAAVSIGTAPTFPGVHGQQERKVEAYLLDVQVDLYGCELRLEFAAWIREQRRFESPKALSAQISRDVDAVRRCTNNETANRKLPCQGR